MIKKLATTVTTGAILLQVLTPLAAADTISGNGAFSTNNATLNNNNTVTAVQNNTANITNTVSTTANTGGNSVSDNTGGMSSVTTGSAGSAVAILNKANVNQASLMMPTTTNTGGLSLSGNGADTNNTATTNMNNTQSLFQTNDAVFTNTVSTNAQTGGNSASNNTSGLTSGGSMITTGNAGSAVQIGNEANANFAALSGQSSLPSTAIVLPTGSMGTGVVGNGFGSSNALTQNQNNTTTAVQGNTATFTNDVTSSNQTGNNTASDNTGFSILPGVTTTTGGLFGISTGNSFGQYTLDNLANFNEASLGNGDMTFSTNPGDLVSGNGAHSSNSLTDNMNNTTSLFQGGDNGNTANFSNTLTPRSNTGSNSVSGSTSGNAILTAGQSFDQTNLMNEANMNEAGTGSTFTLPGGLGLNFSFNLGSLFGLGGM